MLLKSVQNGGVISWGSSKQNSCSFATGSSEETPMLRVYNYDTGSNPTVLGWSEAASPFTSLSWDNFGINGPYPMGVVAGGMTDGSCVFWDV